MDIEGKEGASSKNAAVFNVIVRRNGTGKNRFLRVMCVTLRSAASGR